MSSPLYTRPSVTLSKLTKGNGDVIGPDGAVDGNLAAFDGTTGTLLKDSGIGGTAVELNIAARHSHINSVELAKVSVGDHDVISGNPHGVDASDVGLSNVDNTSDADKPVSTATQAALALRQALSEKGEADGYAGLDSEGKVPSSQLPASVDTIVEVADFASLPDPGVPGVIYVTLDDGKTWRWGGTEYVEISASLVLGSTSSTAHRGDHGAAAYAHVGVATGNPHNVTATNVGLGSVDNTADADKPVSTATQTALDLKEDNLTFDAVPTNASTNPVESNGVFEALATKSDDGHSHVAADVTDFEAAVSANADVAANTAAVHTHDNYEELAKVTDGDHDVSTINPHNVTATQVGLGNADNTADVDKPISAATQTALDLAEKLINKGAVNGYAELDGSGKVPSAQLPAAVDTIVEVADYASLPRPGSSGVIYVTIDDGKTWRWGGTDYVEISSSLALGATSSTAHRGDHGTEAYEHTAAMDNPHNVSLAQLGAASDSHTHTAPDIGAGVFSGEFSFTHDLITEGTGLRLDSGGVGACVISLSDGSAFLIYSDGGGAGDKTLYFTENMDVAGNLNVSGTLLSGGVDIAELFSAVDHAHTADEIQGGTFAQTYTFTNNVSVEDPMLSLDASNTNGLGLVSFCDGAASLMYLDASNSFTFTESVNVTGTLSVDSVDVMAHSALTNNPHAVDAEDVLPDQSGNEGQVLVTDGFVSSWTELANVRNLKSATVSIQSPVSGDSYGLLFAREGVTLKYTHVYLRGASTSTLTFAHVYCTTRTGSSTVIRSTPMTETSGWILHNPSEGAPANNFVWIEISSVVDAPDELWLEVFYEEG